MAKSPALAATLMLMMVICRNLEFVVADHDPPAVANNEPNYSLGCALKCAALCLLLPTLPQKLACSCACLLQCREIPYLSDEVKSCTLDCAESSGNKFFSGSGSQLTTNKDLETLAGFVDVCYDKCKDTKAD